MSYMSVVGICVCCGDVFSFNPFYVPSVMYGGEKQPVCYDCICAANVHRSAQGLEPIFVHKDAYEPEECN